MTQQKWISTFGPDKIIQLVERNKKNNKSLYVTYSKEYDGRARTYHVWKEDRWLYCGMSYEAAMEYMHEDYDND